MILRIIQRQRRANEMPHILIPELLALKASNGFRPIVR